MSQDTDGRPALETARKPVPAGRAGSLSDRVRSLRLTDRPAAAPKRSSRLAWGLCLALAALTYFFAWKAYRRLPAGEDRPGETVVASSPADEDSPNVASSGEVVLESKGNIVPIHKIQVSPKVGGMVEELYFEEGKWVQAGDILARLETVDYKADRDRARAALEETANNLQELTKWRQKEIDQAKARWEEAQVQRKQLALDRQRSEHLRTGSALAERDWEQADSAYLAMLNRERSLRTDYELLIQGPRDSRIHAAEQRVRQADADLVKAQWKLDNCTIKAPISGTILTKKAERGDIVNPIAFNISASLCEMANLAELEVDLNIQERDVARVFQGQACKIRPDAFPKKVYTGFVSRLMPVADRSKGAVPVRVKVAVPRDEERGGFLKPEMGAVVSFLKKHEQDAK